MQPGREARDAELMAVAERAGRPEDHSARDSFLIVLAYMVLGVTWFYAVDLISQAFHLQSPAAARLGFEGGVGFLLLSAFVGYLIGVVYLGRLYRSRSEYFEAQQALRQRDIEIRQTYVDVLDAVTGGKLILMAPEEIENSLGVVVLSPAEISRPEDISEARERIANFLARVTTRTADIETSLSEALTNALTHAKHGQYWIARAGESLQIVVADSGPGIDFRTLPKATLLPGFSTTQSLGMGFTIMLNLSDRLLLSSEPGRTLVVLEFELTGETLKSGVDEGARSTS
jgi:anti-sigma regulatory factor (Ser/Thr protein kinase)